MNVKIAYPYSVKSLKSTQFVMYEFGFNGLESSAWLYVHGMKHPVKYLPFFRARFVHVIEGKAHWDHKGMIDPIFDCARDAENRVTKVISIDRDSFLSGVYGDIHVTKFLKLEKISLNNISVYLPEREQVRPREQVIPKVTRRIWPKKKKKGNKRDKQERKKKR